MIEYIPGLAGVPNTLNTKINHSAILFADKKRQ
jgi:hypothetical protein